ncbi:MAG TPA: tetraacyldisaccharide 4'-kinase [Pseudolabrys sp.]|nr:tetraacyldisaccharide 4'-kinase [Pseudolabrys sp.]
MREPSFWWREPGLTAALLSPFAELYGAVAASRLRQTGAKVSVPVICIGNFTLGGTGKTPATIAIARMLAEAGERPFCLSRGYGGRQTGPITVDAAVHSAADVGDESLLLAREAPTIVSHDRIAGARAAIDGGASVIVMDDGMQNPSLTKDLTIAVVDGRRGIGNAKVFPAGPLRAPLAAQLSGVNALLVLGDMTEASSKVLNAAGRLPVMHGRLVPDAGAVAALENRKVLAFAGIGDPDKFFATVKAVGIAMPVCKSFSDHHAFTAEEASGLVMQAEHEGLTLLTTEKDHMRMTADPALAALCARARTLPVTLDVHEPGEFRKLVLRAIGR